MFKVIEALILDANTGNAKQLSGREKLLGLSRETGPRAQLFEGQERNPGLNFNPSFFFFCSKAFSRIFLKSIFLPTHFIAPSRQIKDNKNETEFAF